MRVFLELISEPRFSYRLRKEDGTETHIAKAISTIVEHHGRYVTIDVPIWWAAREGLLCDVDFYGEIV